MDRSTTFYRKITAYQLYMAVANRKVAVSRTDNVFYKKHMILVNFHQTGFVRYWHEIRFDVSHLWFTTRRFFVQFFDTTSVTNFRTSKVTMFLVFRMWTGFVALFLAYLSDISCIFVGLRLRSWQSQFLGDADPELWRTWIWAGSATQKNRNSFRLSEDKRFDDAVCEPQTILTWVALMVLQIVLSATFRPKEIWGVAVTETLT